MRQVNITFQADVEHKGLTWEQTPIVYILKNVPADYDVLLIADVISRVLGFTMVRSSRLFLNDQLIPKIACHYNGGYHIAEDE